MLIYLQFISNALIVLYGKLHSTNHFLLRRLSFQRYISLHKYSSMTLAMYVTPGLRAKWLFYQNKHQHPLYGLDNTFLTFKRKWIFYLFKHQSLLHWIDTSITFLTCGRKQTINRLKQTHLIDSSSKILYPQHSDNVHVGCLFRNSDVISTPTSTTTQPKLVYAENSK